MNSKIFIFQSKPTIIIWIHNYNCDWESVQIIILLDCLAELFATVHWAHDVVVTNVATTLCVQWVLYTRVKLVFVSAFADAKDDKYLYL